ncbi:MAG: alanine--tRNA ligase-related protein [Candidatus Paceibacterota bacterium]
MVFNEYFCNGSRGQLDKGEIKLEKLPVLGIDTGMGFERLVTVIQNKNSFYGTDLFDEVMSKVNQSDNNNEKSKKIILDHIKASIFLICDGVVPSNTEGGYVLRRLIRRAIVHINSFNIQISLPWLIETITEKYSEIYPDLIQNKTNIEKVLNDEDEKFAKTITLGLKEFEKGVDPFILFTTYGFPIELTEEMAKEKGQKIDLEDFHKKLKEHQKLSQTASAGMFKGGLGGHGEMETQYHTATHLLNGALRMVLGNHVSQKGSNITGERLRFDFSNSQKLTDEEIKRVEDLVNEKIKEALPVTFKEMSLEDAKKTGAQGVFDSKYGDNVTVYQIGENGDIFSLEICGGPHVKNTEELAANPSGTLKHFKIKKEEAVGEGIRRIKAVLE